MDKEELRALTRTFYDMQDMRMRMANRNMLKANAMDQKDNGTYRPKSHDEKVSWYTYSAMKRSIESEESLNKAIKEEIKNHRIYNEFLSGVKGCGTMMSAVLISTIDINKAYTRSALWQYAGLNPSFVKGKKNIDGKIVCTDVMVRGDKLTRGFVAPYNTFLKTKLFVLAECFIKTKSEYTKFYYDYKHRLENEDKWKDTSPKHRDMASRRYMIKMFLADLYVKWRTIEGLDVRPSYNEEYLNHVHHGVDFEMQSVIEEEEAK